MLNPGLNIAFYLQYIMGFNIVYQTSHGSDNPRHTFKKGYINPGGGGYMKSIISKIWVVSYDMLQVKNYDV